MNNYDETILSNNSKYHMNSNKLIEIGTEIGINISDEGMKLNIVNKIKERLIHLNSISYEYIC